MIKFESKKLYLVALTIAIWMAYYVYFKKDEPREMTQDLQKCEATIYKILESEADCLDRLDLYREKLNYCTDLLEEAASQK